MLHEMAEAVAALYPHSSFKAPKFFVPKWLVWLVGPLAGLGRDVVT